MKSSLTAIFAGILIIAVAARLLRGQDATAGRANSWRRFHTPYDSKTSPPLTLPDAYRLVTDYMGVATNRFYCVSTSCLEQTKRGLPGWTFVFSSTNGQRATFEVSFEKEVNPDAQTRSLLQGK